MIQMSHTRVQLSLTIIWLILFVPAIVLWRDSVPFLVFVSVYANFVGHLSAWEAARAQKQMKDSDG